MAVEAAVTAVTLPTSSSSTVDATVSGFGTVTAAIIFVSDANSTNNPQNNGGIGVGFWTPSTNDVATYLYATDNVATTDTFRSATNTKGIFKNSVITFDISAVTDGIRITCSASHTYARFATVILLKGTINALASYAQLTSTSVDVTTPGFKPDLVFVATVAYNSSPTISADPYGIWSFGAAHNNSSDTVSQGGAFLSTVDGVGTSVTATYVDDAYCCAQFYNDTIAWKASLGSFDSSGFTVSASASPSNDYIYYLALELPEPDDAFVGFITAATSTGDQATTGVGFTPEFIAMCGTQATANQSTKQGASLFLGAADGANSYTVDFTDEDAVSTTNNDSLRTTSALNLRDHSGASDATASLSSFDSDGFTLNYSDAAAAAYRILTIAVGDSTAGGGAPTLSSPGVINVLSDRATPQVTLTF